MHILSFIDGEGGGIGKISICWAIFGKDKEFQGINNDFQKPSEMLIFLGKNNCTVLRH